MRRTVLLLFVAISIWPVLDVVAISLRPGDRLRTTELELFPSGATLDSYSYRELLFEAPFWRWMGNSLLVSAAVTLTVVVASIGGYAFSRFRFVGRKALMISILTTQMFPATMLMLPLYLMIAKLGLINTYLSLGVFYVSTALPFCVWQMKGFCDTIPASLEEAARIDGCSRWTAFTKVILPLAVLGLKSFQASMSTQWGLYAAASILVSVPVVIVFILLSKYLVSGLTVGSVKE